MGLANSVQETGPGTLAKLLGGVPDWSAQFDGDLLTTSNGLRLGPRHVRSVDVRRKLAWSDVVVSNHAGESLVLAGMGHLQASRLAEGIRQAVRQVAHGDALLAELRTHGDRIVDWWTRATELMNAATWVTRQQIADCEAVRPRTPSGAELARCWQMPGLGPELAALPLNWRASVEQWAHADLRAMAERHNAGLLWNEKQAMRDWFATVEKSPLTDEQIDATVRFDNRTRVVAAAGSGKTSLMVAKAAYAVTRGIVDPSEILMLAFNEKAAKEMSDRVAARMSGPLPRTATFHSFGLSVIGDVLGKKPTTAELDDDGISRLSQVVDGLRDRDPGFRRDWDIFRLVYGRPGEQLDEESDDLREGRSARYPTLKGDHVRSQGEAMIANWLWINGVQYEYERPYERDVADASHSQYRPDFYYPELRVYHEHWALDADGVPNPAFEGYAESMAWRRNTHRQYGTTLLETTWAHVMDGSDFERLAESLTRLGAHLEEDPYREGPGQAPIEDQQLLRLVRSFMVHAKSNRIAPETLRASTVREALFLRLVGRVMAEWDEGLRREGLVDFEDMILQATDLIRAGRWHSPYRLVMVDEMQDTSRDRGELVQALVAQHRDGFLFAVGDDWQSINRFAGADESLMTRFEDWFGPADTCFLTRTFRSPQSLCDVASEFVSANPAQIRKSVRSSRPGTATPIRIAAAPRGGEAAVVMRHLEALDESAAGTTSVLMMGRYNADQDAVSAVRARRWKHLQFSPIQTVHSAKGAEADHVIVLNVSQGAFPSTIRDDPLLGLAMPVGDSYPYAEERRLFYVALTRARESVLLVSRKGEESPFLAEVVKTGHAMVIHGGSEAHAQACPSCRLGRQVVRTRRADGHQFRACSRYPQCTWTASVRERSFG